MFVDSGGSVSILRKDMFDTVPPSSRPIIKPAIMSLLTATGEASQFIGKVDFEIKLGVHVFKHEFLLAHTDPKKHLKVLCSASLVWSSTNPSARQLIVYRFSNISISSIVAKTTVIILLFIKIVITINEVEHIAVRLEALRMVDRQKGRAVRSTDALVLPNEIKEIKNSIQMLRN
jgi:uncharacterized protein YerC